MSEDNKTIQEALAEIQRKVNEDRAKQVVEMYKSLDEALTSVNVAGKKQSTTGIPKKPAVNQNIPGSKPPSSSGVETAANIGAAASTLPKRALGGAAVGAAVGELGKEVAFGSQTARDIGHALYKIPGVGAASDLALKAREALGIPSTAPKQYQRDSSSLEKPTSGISPAPKTDKPMSSVSPAPKPAPKAAPKTDDMSFGQAFKKARENISGTGQFSWHGKDYQTNIKGSGTAEKPQEKYVAPSAQTKTGVDVPKPQETKTPPSTEDGKKKKMSEDTNPLIASFLALQEKNSSNMFVEAKKLSKKQDEKLDVVDDDKIDAKDLAALRAGKKKVEEESADHLGSSTVTKDKKGYVDPSTPKVPYSELPKPGNAAGDVLSKAKGAAGVKEETEEVTFSQAEIDHINSFFLEASVAPTRPEVATGADSTSDKMSQNDVTGTSTESGKRIRKEEIELEEGFAKIVKGIKRSLKGWPAEPLHGSGGNKPKDVVKRTRERSDSDVKSLASDSNKAAEHSPAGLQKNVAKQEMKRRNLEEGRPKKNPEPETTDRDPRQHIQVQAGRAAAGNVIDFHHNDGTKSKITPAMGRRITAHLNGLKPADRQTAVNKMHDSAEGLKV